MEKTFCFHIVFSDGSNPYWHFPTTYRRHYNALCKWKRAYILTRTDRKRAASGGIMETYIAKERGLAQ